jgi:hypothetical protein
MSKLPNKTGVVLTADHGMVDVPQHKHILMDADPDLLRGVSMIGGEPRLRYLFLESSSVQARHALAERWRDSHASVARILTREDALETGFFGPVDDTAADRIGDIVIAATGGVAFYTSGESDLQSRQMVGQHGSISEDELGIPVVRFGAFSDR